MDQRDRNDKNDREEGGGAGRVGIIWGGIGGIVGFLFALLGSFAGIIAAAFIGFSCGRRAAVAGEGKRSGSVSGLVSGALAAPIFVMGAAAGAILTAQQVGASELAASTASIAESFGVPDLQITPEEAWNFFLIGTAFAAVIQAAVLIGVSAAAGAWALRKKQSESE